MFPAKGNFTLDICVNFSTITCYTNTENIETYVDYEINIYLSP